MKSNGFEISAEKTVLVVFIRDVQSRGDFWVRIVENVVQPSKQAKFLGVTITHVVFELDASRQEPHYQG